MKNQVEKYNNTWLTADPDPNTKKLSIYHWSFPMRVKDFAAQTYLKKTRIVLVIQTVSYNFG